MRRLPAHAAGVRAPGRTTRGVAEGGSDAPCLGGCPGASTGNGPRVRDSENAPADPKVRGGVLLRSPVDVPVTDRAAPPPGGSWPAGCSDGRRGEERRTPVRRRACATTSDLKVAVVRTAGMTRSRRLLEGEGESPGPTGLSTTYPSPDCGKPRLRELRGVGGGLTEPSPTPDTRPVGVGGLDLRCRRP